MTSENEFNSVETKEEKNETINIEKPKRPGRKKRDVSSTDDVNHLNISDTQPLFEQPIIIEGKRSRKPTSRLELSELTTPKKEFSIPQGQGKPLGEIEFVNYQLNNASNDVLSRLHNICFGRRAGQINLRKNLREFKGFEFQRETDEYQRHLNNLLKLKKEHLSSISDIFGQTSNDRNEENAEKILNFLLKPIDEGKSIPEENISLRQSKNSKESNRTDDDEENFKNGDDNDDEYFNEEESVETDDDYIGSDDDESGLNIRDDPDDFVYQPGKKSPKKRTRSGTTNRKKRVTNKRGRKRSKLIIDEPIENQEKSVDDEQIETKIDEKDSKFSETHDILSNNKETDIK